MGLSRKLLLQAVDSQPDIAARVLLTLPQTDAQSCTGCLRCTRTCPTGARQPNPEDGALAFDGRYCIGCGLCVQACPHDAVTLTTKPLSKVPC